MRNLSIETCSALNAIQPGHCRQLRRAVSTLKIRLRDRFEREFPHAAEQVEAALVDAEALAWKTTVPHLVLPVLAEEMVNRVSARKSPAAQEFQVRSLNQFSDDYEHAY